MATPSRATANTVLSLGAIAIPVSLYSATDRPPSGSRYVFDADRNPQPVGNRDYNKETQQDVDKSQEVVTLWTVDDKLVRIDKEEIAAAVDFPAGTAEVVGFIKQSHLGGTYNPEALYQIRPQKTTVGKKKVPNAAADRAFALVCAAMRKTATFALLRFQLRSLPRYGAFLPNGRLYILTYTEDVRDALPLPDSDVNDAELELMIKMVQNKLVTEPVPLVDVARNVRFDIARQKIADGKALEVVEIAELDSQPVQTADDLRALLESELSNG